MLTPNAELAAALTDAVERHHLAAGHAVWRSPRIRDFAGWLRGRHAGRLLMQSGLPRMLSEVEERELWRAVVEDSPAARELLDPGGAARAARRARHAMADYGIPEAALDAHDGEEVAALLQWSRLFDRRCRELDCLPADRLLQVALPPDEPVRWIDSDQWRPMARRWLERHAGAPIAPMTTMPARARRIQAPSPRAEVEAMAAWAADQLTHDPEFRAWVCVADLTLRRREIEDAFDAVLAPQRWHLGGAGAPAPYAVAGGTPLAGHAPVGAALALLSAAAGNVSFESFSALLRAPEWSQSTAESGAAAALDLRLRSRGPHAAPLRTWLALAATPPAADGAAERADGSVQRLAAALQVLEAVRGVQPMSRWVTLWVEAFESGPWSHRQRWSSGEFQAAERLRELLATLATADAVFGPTTFAAAVRLLLRAAGDTAFQPQTGIPPIWISGRVMDPWLAYDGLWLAGFGEDRWPPRVDPLPLIPVRLQREHGVPEADPQAQLERALGLQQRWRQRAALQVSSAADAVDGRACRLSPLLAADADADAADPAESAQLPPPHVALADPPPPHWQAQRRQLPHLERLIDEQAPVFAAPETLRGVATLRAQSLCAFRGFAETRLATGPLERPSPGFNVRERGEMLHASLEQVWTELRDSQRLAATAPTELAALTERAASAAVERQCRRRDPGAPWQARERRRIAALLDRWLELERRRPPFVVATLEGAARVARHGGLEFKVRIDRVDVLEQGGRVLIDYKTGAASPDWRGDRPENPQLPVYALLQPEDLVAVAYGRVNARDCGFVAEAARGGIFKPGARPTSMEGMPSFEALLELWSRRLDLIAREFASGHAAAAPTARACDSCCLQALCRIPGTAAGSDPDEAAAAALESVALESLDG